jgi:hypothetical protein
LVFLVLIWFINFVPEFCAVFNRPVTAFLFLPLFDERLLFDGPLFDLGLVRRASPLLLLRFRGLPASVGQLVFVVSLLFLLSDNLDNVRPNFPHSEFLLLFLPLAALVNEIRQIAIITILRVVVDGIVKNFIFVRFSSVISFFEIDSQSVSEFRCSFQLMLLFNCLDA